MKRGRVFCVAIGMILSCPSAANAVSYSGSLSVPGGGLDGQGDDRWWIPDQNDPEQGTAQTTLAWEVTDEDDGEGVWRYTYTLTVDPKGGRLDPLGVNVGLLDARVKWRPWQTVDASRYVVDGSVLMW